MLRLFAIVLFACALANTALAQSAAPLYPSRIEVDDNGTCLRDDLAWLPELGPDRLRLGRGFTYVMTGEPRLRRSFNRNAAATRRQPAQFDPLILYALDNASGSLLVGTKNLDLCGWIDPEAVLYTRGAPVSDYAFGPKRVMVKDGPDGESNKDSDLTLKVVLQNLNKDDAPGAGSRANRAIPILPNPGHSVQSPNLKTRQLFFVNEVFAWAKAKDPDDMNAQEAIYYLIGRGGDPGDTGMIDGWVHQDSVYVWTTRIAAGWAGTGEGKGYAKKELIGSDQFAIVEPPSGRLREPDNRTPQRFPVIDQSPSTADLSRRFRGRPAEVSQSIDRMIEHYRIATEAVPRTEQSTPTVGAFYFGPHTADGQRQIFNFYLALEEAAFKRLSRAVRDLCASIDRTQGIGILRRAISEALDIALDNNHSIADVFAKKLHIPAYHLNPLLMMPLGDLEEHHRHATSNGRIVAIKKGFCKSSRLLTWAEENRRIWPDQRSMVWDAAQSVWKPDSDRNLRPYLWKHESGGGVPIYYIPLEFLPRLDASAN